MIDFDEIFPFIVAAFVATALFFMLISTISKSLKAPISHDPIDSSMELREQQRRMDDIRQRQKQLMRDQKQKIRDLQRL